MGWRWDWPGAGGQVKAYPEVMYGDSPWDDEPPTGALPLPVGDCELVVTYDASLEASGKWNVALEIGFVFYPGGRIDPRGYAPLMKAIAFEGYLVVVPKMPLNIAAFRPNVAAKIVAAHPEIRRWAIGGHSVGGAMAAQYTHTHSESIDGLAIWASYPPGNADLPSLALPVVLICEHPYPNHQKARFHPDVRLVERLH